MLFRVNTFSSGDWNTCDVFNEKILNKKVFNINFCCLCYKTNFTQSSEGIIWSEISLITQTTEIYVKNFFI